MIAMIKEYYTRFMHGPCIQAGIDADNKYRKHHAQEIGQLQDQLAELQEENLRLHKEILFTQEGNEIEKGTK